MFTDRKDQVPYTAKQKRFFGMCSNPTSRKNASGKCPPLPVAKRLAKEAAHTKTKKMK